MIYAKDWNEEREARKENLGHAVKVRPNSCTYSPVHLGAARADEAYSLVNASSAELARARHQQGDGLRCQPF